MARAGWAQRCSVPQRPQPQLNTGAALSLRALRPDPQPGTAGLRGARGAQELPGHRN